jgi:hypothetical protein
VFSFSAILLQILFWLFGMRYDFDLSIWERKILSIRMNVFSGGAGSFSRLGSLIQVLKRSKLIRQVVKHQIYYSVHISVSNLIIQQAIKA